MAKPIIIDGGWEEKCGISNFQFWKYVKNWKNIPNNGCILPLIGYGTNNSEVENQLQVIWMIAVSLFGNYGTSPRSGWIESNRYKDFCEWIDKICQGCEDE